MDGYRVESDFLGEVKVDEGKKYGVHSLRAVENFPHKSPFSIHWYKAIGDLKRGVYRTVLSFKEGLKRKSPDLNLMIAIPDDKSLNLMITAADEVSRGLFYEDFIIPAISGGAGTSINMNINEIIANRALELSGRSYGDYQYIDPINDSNIFQSTNDLIPSALKVAVMKLLKQLEESINGLRLESERLENLYRDYLRVGFTQMQEAVPSSYGRLFSAYNNALSRDWWRVSKCFERIKVLNLGGGAIGTGLAIPRYFILEVINTVKRETNLPLSRSENMSDTTSNLDSFVEVHAIMKSLAVNLEKMVSDLRLLGSDLVDSGMKLPERQTGSSIMPGKVNPVIVEYVVSCCSKIYSNDQLITDLSAKGCLELNPYIPAIGDALLQSLEFLISSCNTIKSNLLKDLTIVKVDNPIESSISITTALVPYLGYKRCSEIANLMKNSRLTIYECNKELDFISESKLKEILYPSNLLKMGFSIQDLK